MNHLPPLRTEWMTLGIETWMLGLEASAVVAARLYGFAWQLPGSDREAQRMVEEKWQALAELQMRWLTGGLGTTPLDSGTRTVAHYRRKVRANQRRLARR